MWGATNDTPNKMAPVCGEIESPSNLSRKSGKKLLLKWQWNTWKTKNKKNKDNEIPDACPVFAFSDACSLKAKAWQIFVEGVQTVFEYHQISNNTGFFFPFNWSNRRETKIL